MDQPLDLLPGILQTGFFVVWNSQRQGNRSKFLHRRWRYADASLAHPLSPESPEASVGLQVLGRTHRSLAALHIHITMNWGVAVGCAVISFFKRRFKKKNMIQPTDGGSHSSDTSYYFCWNAYRNCVILHVSAREVVESGKQIGAANTLKA